MGGGGGGSGPKEVGSFEEEEPTTQTNRTNLSIDQTKKKDPNKKTGLHTGMLGGVADSMQQSNRYG
tara:strand:+ start:379 stop:576 length:198 start_codon:yes stop_codon:yes gene_type:complete